MSHDSTPGPEVSFDARRALSGVAGLACAGAMILTAHSFLGVGLPCPLFSLTGIQCPLCGTTRAARALLGGDLASAWSQNAWTTSLGGVLAICVVAWVIEVAGGPRLRPPRWIGPVTQNRVYLWLGISGVVFMVIRNLV